MVSLGNGGIAGAKRTRILLVEPHLVLRQTVASTVRSLGIGEVDQAATNAAATKLVEDISYHIIVLAIENDDGQAKMEADLAVVDRIRHGQTQCHENAFVVLSTTSCDAALLDAIGKRLVNKVLIKPFRVRDIVDTLSTAVTQPRQSMPGR